MARPISAEAKEDLKDLLPGIRIMVDLSREKVRTQQNQEMVVSYVCPILFTGQKICQLPIKH